MKYIYIYIYKIPSKDLFALTNFLKSTTQRGQRSNRLAFETTKVSFPSGGVLSVLSRMGSCKLCSLPSPPRRNLFAYTFCKITLRGLHPALAPSQRGAPEFDRALASSLPCPPCRQTTLPRVSFSSREGP